MGGGRGGEDLARIENEERRGTCSIPTRSEPESPSLSPSAGPRAERRASTEGSSALLSFLLSPPPGRSAPDYLGSECLIEALYRRDRSCWLLGCLAPLLVFSQRDTPAPPPRLSPSDPFLSFSRSLSRFSHRRRFNCHLRLTTTTNRPPPHPLYVYSFICCWLIPHYRDRSTDKRTVLGNTQCAPPSSGSSLLLLPPLPSAGRGKEGRRGGGIRSTIRRPAHPCPFLHPSQPPRPSVVPSFSSASAFRFLRPSFSVPRFDSTRCGLYRESRYQRGPLSCIRLASVSVRPTRAELPLHGISPFDVTSRDPLHFIALSRTRESNFHLLVAR